MKELIQCDCKKLFYWEDNLQCEYNEEFKQYDTFCKCPHCGEEYVHLSDDMLENICEMLKFCVRLAVFSKSTKVKEE